MLAWLVLFCQLIGRKASEIRGPQSCFMNSLKHRCVTQPVGCIGTNGYYDKPDVLKLEAKDPIVNILDQIDAFAAGPFQGNPAAVCLLESPGTTAWMQSVALEMNLSETAFIHRIESDDGSLYELRWFTPKIEVDLCGHATLAAAHLLWDRGLIRPNQLARFDTKSGRLTARREGEEIVLDFPAVRSSAIEPPPSLADGLGVEPIAVLSNRFDLLLEFDSAELVRNLQPDFRQLATIEARGIIVTARSDLPTESDFISRFFAPRAGIDEDPVTGSAHCALGPYWGPKLSKVAMRGFQASPRGGHVGVRLVEDRVELTGRAVTVFRGDLLV